MVMYCGVCVVCVCVCVVCECVWCLQVKELGYGVYVSFMDVCVVCVDVCKCMQMCDLHLCIGHEFEVCRWMERERE